MQAACPLKQCIIGRSAAITSFLGFLVQEGGSGNLGYQALIPYYCATNIDLLKRKESKLMSFLSVPYQSCLILGISMFLGFS